MDYGARLESIEPPSERKHEHGHASGKPKSLVAVGLDFTESTSSEYECSSPRSPSSTVRSGARAYKHLTRRVLLTKALPSPPRPKRPISSISFAVGNKYSNTDIAVSPRIWGIIESWQQPNVPQTLVTSADGPTLASKRPSGRNIGLPPRLVPESQVWPSQAFNRVSWSKNSAPVTSKDTASLASSPKLSIRSLKFRREKKPLISTPRPIRLPYLLECSHNQPLSLSPSSLEASDAGTKGIGEFTQPGPDDGSRRLSRSFSSLLTKLTSWGHNKRAAKPAGGSSSTHMRWSVNSHTQWSVSETLMHRSDDKQHLSGNVTTSEYTQCSKPGLFPVAETKMSKMTRADSVSFTEFGSKSGAAAADRLSGKPANPEPAGQGKDQAKSGQGKISYRKKLSIYRRKWNEGLPPGIQ